MAGHEAEKHIHPAATFYRDGMRFYRCLKCDHVWLPKKPGIPTQCPNQECRTAYWYQKDRPAPGRKKKKPDVVSNQLELFKEGGIHSGTDKKRATEKL